MKKEDILSLLILLIIGLSIVALSSYKYTKTSTENNDSDMNIITSKEVSEDISEESYDASSEEQFIHDINLVTFDQLLEIDGLSVDIARNIIKFREENGEYQYILQLLEVEGMTYDLYEYLIIFLFVI